MKAYFSRAILLFIAFTVVANAYSVSSVDSFLEGYNISSSTVSSLTFTNITYNGHSYVLLYSDGTPSFLLNVTGGYSFVLNQSQIAQISSGALISSSLKNYNFAGLINSLQAYEATSTGAINNCLNETGINRNQSCTVANNCEACQLVPVCSETLYKTDGPTGPLGFGIGEFEAEFDNYTDNTTRFYNAASNVSSSNAQASIATISSTFTNIEDITKIMPQNPLFNTVTINSSFENCDLYDTVQSAPWYCYSIAFCGDPNGLLDFNYTMLSGIQSKINQLNALPISSAQISLTAGNIASNEDTYVLPKLGAQKSAQLKVILNTTLPNYDALVNGSSELLIHISNATLSNDLSSLEALHANLLTNYISLNLTSQNKSIASAYHNLSTVYSKQNATYSKMLSTAQSNTATIIKAQLSSTSPIANLANYAFQEMQLNIILAGQVSNVSEESKNLQSVSSSVQSYSGYSSPLGPVAIARGIDGPFSVLMGSVLKLPYSGSIALVPAYGAILSAIIGIIVIALLFGSYESMKKKRKIVLTKRTQANWNMLFVVVIVLVILYIALTYVSASSANTLAPASSFTGAVASSKSVVIALNGTTSSGMLSCAAALTSKLDALKKNVISASISNGQCTVANSTKSASACMDSYTQSSTPMIILTNSNSTSMGIYSMYGTVLRENGNSATLAQCYATVLLPSALQVPATTTTTAKSSTTTVAKTNSTK